jgi:uncharacterized delta-60 repeat protein
MPVPSFDSTFDFDGIVITDFGGTNDQAHDLIIDNSGKIVVTGFANISGNRFAVARYNTDGTLDTTLDTDGRVTTSFFAGGQSYAVTIDSNNKILAVGSGNNDTSNKFALVRYNPNGTLDTIFNAGGTVYTSFFALGDYAQGVAIDSTNRILAAGYAWNGTDYDIALARYGINGALDTTFNGTGKVTTGFPGTDELGYSITLQSDNKILVGGSLFTATDFDFGLIRYNTDGTLDNTFGTGGIVTTDFFNNYEEGFIVKVQSDGKILVAGGPINISTDDDFGIVRYNPNGTLDNTFGVGGQVSTDFFGGADIVNSLVIDSNGNILVVGEVFNGIDYDFGIARYDINGNLDPTFGIGGKYSLDIVPGNNDFPRSIILEGSDKIVIAGDSTDGVNSNFIVVRLNLEIAPVANNDVAGTSFGTPVTINVIANDSDLNNDIEPAKVDLQTGLAGIQNTATVTDGLFSVNNSGIVTFTPNSNFISATVRSIQYQVYDLTSLSSNIANISIAGINTPPIATDDTTTTIINTPITINISTNDSDPGGSITAFDLNVLTGDVQNTITTSAGTFSTNNSGVLIFNPASNFQGTASLPYQIFDNSGATATANISVLVTNQLPIAVSDSTSTISNTAVTLNISTNDSDPDGSITAFDLDTSNPTIQQAFTNSQGVFSVNNSGILSFIPASNFQGTASLPYQIFDNSGATATANISVLVTNQLPIAVSDSTSTISNTAVTFNISANDSDPDGSITAFDLDTSNPTIQQAITNSQGVFSVNNSGILSFIPASDFQGTASLPYQIFDNSGATATANISVLVTNQLPIAVSDSTSTISNTAITLNISANDSDPDGSITAFDLDTSNPTIQQAITNSQGIFSVNNNGVLVFTPASNFQGTASLPYQIFDNSGATATANISVLVTNQLPIAVNDITSTISNTAVTLNISANDSDPDGSITAFDLDASNPTIQQNITTTQGIFSVNNSGILSFTPASNFQGIASLPYQIFDNSGATATANISIVVGNQLPVANNDSTNTTSNTAVTLNISANDSDVDGSITTFDLNIANTTIQQNITNSQGIFSVNDNGILIFRPANNFQGIASLPYQIFDNSGATATANISIVVGNQSPIANDDSTNTTSNTAVTLNISANDSDVDGSITTFDLNIANTSIQQNITNSQGTFSVNNNGVLVFRPASDFVGIASLDYQIFDNSGATATANISILVEDIPTPENILPIANNDSTSTIINTAVTLNISTNDSDIDGNITAFDLNISNTSIQQNITNSQGVFSVDDNGILVFSPASDFVGIASLDYQIFDNSGATATANISILVEDIPTPENILPIANDDSTSTIINTAVTLNISANDSDIDGNITAFDLNISNTSIQQNITNSQGVFSVDDNGVLVFSPASDFVGIASLDYQIFDNSGATATANISILVEDIPTPENILPIANDDSTNTTTNTAVTLNISANDSDIDGSITAFDLNISNTSIQQNITNSQGTFSVNSNGVLIFSPASDFVGIASLDYQVFDNSGATATANISILVENIPTPEPPTPIPPTPIPPTPIPPTPIPEPNDRPNYPIVNKLAILNITDIPSNGNLMGDEQDNLIYGEIPNDTILGFQGNDTLVGYVFDSLNGQNDFGDNILVGGDGNDYLFGSVGNDSLFGETGDDQIIAGAGNDLLQGGTGNDTLSGREGDDLIIDAFTDNDGNNLIYGQSGNDTVQGGNQVDSVSGGKGNDWIQAGDADDWLLGDFGSDTLFGEGGNDTLSGDNDLGEPTEPEDLIRQDLLMGGEGDDLLLGNQDNDTLLGESGNDHIRGGKDDDLIFGDSEIDSIAGNDLLFGDAGNDTIIGGGGDDTIYGDNADIVGADVNTLRDLLLGDIGNDLIYGNKGDDTLLGRDGNDTLSGGKENDLLFGGLGDDVLIGGFGDDTITTGAGNDLIYLAVDQGVNLIRDFQPGVDQLILIDGLTIDQLEFTASDGGTVITYKNDNQVLGIVQGVNPQQLI